MQLDTLEIPLQAIDSISDTNSVGEQIIFHEDLPQPLADSCPQPEYPQKALSSGLRGKVVILAYVDDAGKVRKWKIAREEPLDLGFADEVGKVIPRWRFEPARRDGKPIGVWIAIPFTFIPPKAKESEHGR